MTDTSEEAPPKKTTSRWKRRLLIALLVIVIGLVLLAGAAGGLFYYAKTEFEAPGQNEEEIYTLEKGRGLNQIASELEQKNVIEHSLLFRAGVLYHQAQGDLKAGEYAIPASASMADIMELLRAGKSILYKITIPEGLTSVQAMRLVAADETLQGDLGDIPEEGMLLPETYLFQRGTTRVELVARMMAAKEDLLAKLWATRAENIPLKTPYEALILASIVEKETGLAEERPLVAAAFTNRLRRGMRLESDPTIIYGLTQGEPLGRGLRVSELKKVTPYNTYEVDGLPPTPIANAGRDALAAVLNPPDSKVLFFVADGSGGHVFAKTYREHRRNVAQWRKVERKRKKKAQ